MKITNYKNLQSVDDLDEISDDELDTRGCCSCNSQKVVCADEDRSTSLVASAFGLMIAIAIIQKT